MIYRIRIMRDWISGKNLTFRHKSDKLSWDDFCTVLEVCFFYSTCQCPSSSGILTILMSRYLRRQFQSQPNSELTWREVLLAMKSCKPPKETLAYHLYAFNWLVNSVGKASPQDLIVAPDDLTFLVQAANLLGLLSLSLVERQSQSISNHILASWVPDWSLRRNCFLLNHPSSNFWASAIRDESCQIVEEVMQFKGIAFDSIKATSAYLPWRRHCDHYDLAGFNVVTFSEWFEFAQHAKRRFRQTEDNDARLFVEFADTIQARGCNSIWEPSPPQGPEELAESTKNFLAFLETDNAEVTLDLQLFYAACYPSHGRKFGVTKRGHFCLVPGDAGRGDLVCIPHGGRVPVILRRMNQHYQNIGECYVNGCMQGIDASVLDGCKEELFLVR